MQKYFSFFIAAIFCISAGVLDMTAGRFAATSSDSIPSLSKAQLDSLRQQAIVDSLMSKDLGEVTVEGQKTRFSANSSVYLTTANQRNAAQNITQLLQLMAIPQIRVNPQSNSVTDNFGKEIAIFINYLPATDEDREGLRTADVRKVEYLEFPSDPRFRGAEKVLNFFVQEYEYGGYTKIFTRSMGPRSFHSNDNIFSKFAYKKMTYDFFTQLRYFYDSHYRVMENSTFRIPDNDGKVSEFTRNQISDHGLVHQYLLPVTFRATYQNEKVQIRNTFGYNYWRNPEIGYSGTLYNSALTPPDGTFSNSTTYRSHSFSYTGDLFFKLPSDFSLSVTPGFKYSHNKYHLGYWSITPPEIIDNEKENAYTAQLNFSLRKQFNKFHAATLDFQHSQKHNNVQTFNGLVDVTDRSHQYDYRASLGYHLNRQNISVKAIAGLSWNNTDMNHKTTSAVAPYLQLASSFSFNDKNMINIEASYHSVSPGALNKVESITQTNEMMYVTGNPLLKNYNSMELSAAYNWAPSNSFSMSVYGSTEQSYNRRLFFYRPYDDGRAVICAPINNGDFYKYTAGVSTGLNCFNNSLNISLMPSVSYYKSTGLYRADKTAFNFSASASYYLKQFFVWGYIFAPITEFAASSTMITKHRSQYSLNIGWGNGNWNIALVASDFFNNGFYKMIQTLNTPIITNEIKNYDLSYSRMFGISVTYTFGYGKKIKRGDEVGAQSGASSIVTQ